MSDNTEGQSRTYAYSSEKLASYGTQDHVRQSKNTTQHNTGICKQTQAT